jgi:hypothetical protein
VTGEPRFRPGQLGARFVEQLGQAQAERPADRGQDLGRCFLPPPLKFREVLDRHARGTGDILQGPSLPEPNPS